LIRIDLASLFLLFLFLQPRLHLVLLANIAGTASRRGLR